MMCSSPYKNIVQNRRTCIFTQVNKLTKNDTVFTTIIGNLVVYHSMVGAQLGHGWGKVGVWLGQSWEGNNINTIEIWSAVRACSCLGKAGKDIIEIQ